MKVIEFHGRFPPQSASLYNHKSRPTLRGFLSRFGTFGTAAGAATAEADEEGDQAGDQDGRAARRHDLGVLSRT